MVRRDGVTKVVDFGIARAANRSSRTATGSVKGKMAYIAPEQLLSRDVDGRADQWALGVVCWELLTHQRLFRGQNDLEIMQQVVKGDLARPSALAPGLPPGLDGLVMRMLEREPSRRFESCGVVAEEIDALVDYNSSPRISGERRIADFIRTLASEAAAGAAQGGAGPGNFFISLKEMPVVAAPLVATPQSQSQKSVKSELPTRTGSGASTAPARSFSKQLAIAVGVLLLASVALVAVLLRQPDTVTISAPIVAPRTTASLTLRTEPVAAQVELDGEKLGLSPLTRELQPGKHHVKLTAAGYAPVDSHVELEAGQNRDVLIPMSAAPVTPPPVAVKLPPALKAPGGKKPPSQAAAAAQPSEPAAPADTSGYLSVSTDPWTQLTIDGEPYGSTPLYRQRLAAGAHEVVMTNPGAGVNQKRSVKIEGGQTLKLNLKF
jgi:serine/threonine-protein kinase